MPKLQMLSIFYQVMAALLTIGAGSFVDAVQPTSPVSPSLEIEVLDPGVDPLGNPAVSLLDTDVPGQQLVDIPPTILVHRYYYTGDRSFQAQLLSGGPCIVVANHPKTGERTYTPVQMTPGAPRVRYTGRKIEYDFGNRGISVVYGLGDPVVRYRNGKKWTEKVSTVLHLEHTVRTAKQLHAASTRASDGVKTLLSGTVLYASDGVGQFLAPLKQVVELGPLNGLGDRLHQRVEQHRADKELKATETRDREWVRRFP